MRDGKAHWIAGTPPELDKIQCTNRREGVCRWCDDKERSFRERMDRRKGRAA